ncbi:MAG: DUF4843 domain-containing protein [Bacteroides sp.]|nr:DUF4843 domain-containing protein [Bacteroides sp.]
MKRILFHTMICGFLLGLSASCEKDLPVYDYADSMLNFDLQISSETQEPELTSYSFVYVDEAVEEDTVWVTVKTMGFLSDQDRPIELEQVKSGEKDAQPGVHYVPFDDPELKAKYYYIPANEVDRKIPIVVKKDVSLSSESVYLYVTFKDNGYFRSGYPLYSVMRLNISNMLTKPAAWDSYADYFFDKYGPVKHKFMIDVTGLKWDNEFLEAHLYGEQGYLTYLAQLCDKELRLENARRAEQGLGVLAEDEEGLDPVTFSHGAYYNGYY